MKAYESPYSAQETVATISPSRSVARNESGSAARKRAASSSPGFQPSAAAHEIATWAAGSTSIFSGGDVTALSRPRGCGPGRTVAVRRLGGLEVLVHERDRHAALADGGRHALHGREAHVAARKDARH